MTLDTTASGTGRNVVYTLKVETDPGAKAELQKFKQSVQEAFKEIGAKQAEARDQAMRGPQINIERMRTQLQQESRRRQYDVLQHGEELNSQRASQTRQTMFQLGMPNAENEQHLESTASGGMACDMALMLPTGQPTNATRVNSAGSFRGITSSQTTAGDHNSRDLQNSISVVINALAKMAKALGSADQEMNSRRNASLQRANRDAAFG